MTISLPIPICSVKVKCSKGSSKFPSCAAKHCWLALSILLHDLRFFMQNVPSTNPVLLKRFLEYETLSVLPDTNHQWRSVQLWPCACLLKLPIIFPTLYRWGDTGCLETCRYGGVLFVTIYWEAMASRVSLKSLLSSGTKLLIFD